MKFRRHHNNTGEHQVRTGQTRRQVERMADRLGIPMWRTDVPVSHGAITLEMIKEELSHEMAVPGPVVHLMRGGEWCSVCGPRWAWSHGDRGDQ